MKKNRFITKSSIVQFLLVGLVLSTILLSLSCRTQEATTTTTTTTTQPTTTPTTTTTLTITPQTTSAPQGTEKVRIIRHSMSELESGLTVVTGTVKNVTSSWIAVVEVWVKFYDTAGGVIGTSSDMTNNDLGPDETWSFFIVYWGPNPDNVKSYTVEIGVPN